MDNSVTWIWLNKEAYPDVQTGEFTNFCADRAENRYVLADFIKRTEFEKNIVSADIDICADVRYWLYINGGYIGTGPVCSGGDYGNTKPMKYRYYNSYNADNINSNEFEIYVQVQKNTTTQCDMSNGHGGLAVEVILHFDDGSTERITTGKDWRGRINNCRFGVNKSDFSAVPEKYKPVSIVSGIWNLKKSPIENITEEKIIPKNFTEINVCRGELKTIELEYDRIYSGCHMLEIEADSDYTVTIKSYERDRESAFYADEVIIGKGNLSFRGLEMHSVGAVTVHICNNSEKDMKIKNIGLYFMHYPKSELQGDFNCSDTGLNTIFDMGRHALQICRQSIELDSPKHQENLGCTGDYFISSLMNYFTDGDTKLSRFDVIRTAEYLEMTDGCMFHTTYSMIWIMMLYDNYMFSGDESVLLLSQTALKKLLERFDGYIDDRDIISKAPNYMFVDWLVNDGYSMHHPPMSMGQSVLNGFYIGGLERAVEIFKIIGDNESENKYSKRLEKSKIAFNKYFYDSERQLYFDGLNEEYTENTWLPRNSKKRYFSRHTNTLAVLYDIAPKEKQQDIMRNILNDSKMTNPQPYFMHFVLEAIYKTGLFEEYGIGQLKRWECMTDFKKGLQEGWYKPESTYSFDYSHVWAGTPTYQLPSKLSGLTIVEPGMKKIRLKPNLFGLEYARIKIPTKYGLIDINMKKGQEPVIKTPDQIFAEILT